MKSVVNGSKAASSIASSTVSQLEAKNTQNKTKLKLKTLFKNVDSGKYIRRH
jgi:hypothetical protein